MPTALTISKKEIQKAIFKMILPIIGSNILEMLVGFVSMALIGNLGFISIGAMGLSTRVRGIIWSVYKGISIGAQVVVAQAYGAGRPDKIREATRQTLSSLMILSLLFLMSIWIWPEFWLGIFGAKGELLGVSKQVLLVVSLGLPFLGIVVAVSGILQGKGDAVSPMWVSTFMNVLNATLGIIMVNGFWIIPRMGLMGAAYAMVISQFLAAVLALYFLMRRSGILEGIKHREWLIFSKSIIKSVYSTGIPSAVESLFWQLSSILLIRAILSYGDHVYAAYQLGLQAESLAYMPAAGFGVAATAYIGRYLGAGDPVLARRYFKEIMLWAVIMSCIGGGLLVLIPVPLLSIMTHNAQLLDIAKVYLIICGIAQVPQNMAGVLGGALRGAGYTKAPMYSAALGLYGVRVPLSLVSAYLFNWSVNIVFLAIGLDMCSRLVFNTWLYYKTNIYKNPRIV
jgi:putative MATE family efflux protein